MRFLNSLLAVGSLAAVAQAAYQRDRSFPSCGNTTVTNKLYPPIIQDLHPVMGTERRMSKPFKTDSKIFFLTPGLGACDNTYTNDTMGVCVTPGNGNSGEIPGCDRQIALWTPGETDYNKVKFARVVDVCGADHSAEAKEFGCNDLYATVELFKQLTPGDKRADNIALDAGYVPLNIAWAFTSDGPETDADCDDPTKKQASVIINPNMPPKCNKKKGSKRA